MGLDQNQQLPWEQPGWFDQASNWIHAELERNRRVIAGPIELLHTRPWSAFALVPTQQGPVYFKAASPSLRFEAAITQALARWRPDCMLPVIAADLERGWMLSSHAGVTLRSLMQSVDDLRHWHKVLALYAEVQIELVSRAPELVALGMPDRRLATLPRLFKRLLEDTDNLRVGLPKGLTHEEYRRLRDLRPRFDALCEHLAGYALPETICHEEIHDNNVVFGSGQYTFADWSDSSVAHPFFTMLVTLRSVAYRLKLDEDGLEVMRLRDIYLEPWTQFGSPGDLRAAFQLAYRLAMVNRSLSYHRILGPLPERYKVEDNAIPGWLQDFLDAEAKAGNPPGGPSTGRP
jgi:hypothetical protein